ncbi:MAG: hypothetical protein LR015_08090 [Verrucomicrobia bacterium]|nr:hypothetical protein [Verrucomicrobiota bacterium]
MVNITDLVLRYREVFFGAVHYSLMKQVMESHEGDSVTVEVWEADLRIAEKSYQQFTVIVERDVPRRVIRIEGDTFVMHLEQSLQRPFSASHPIEFGKGRYRAEVPPLWVAYTEVPAEQKHRTFFNSADGHAMAIWLLAHGECCDESLESVINREVNLLNQFLRNYKRDNEEGFLQRTIGGVEALGVRGSFMDRNKVMRDERYYFVHNRQLHWVVLRAQESDWEEYLAEFESIMDSIQLNNTEGQ